MVDEAAVVAECRSRFPDSQVELVSVHTRPSLCVLRSPTLHEHRAFQASLRDDAMKGEAFRNIFVTICVYPSPQEVTGVLAHQKVQNAVAWLTGQADDLLGKNWPAP